VLFFLRPKLLFFTEICGIFILVLLLAWSCFISGSVLSDRKTFREKRVPGIIDQVYIACFGRSQANPTIVL
jgi:hypothetical protein